MKRLTAAITALVMVVVLLGLAARPAASQDSGVTYYTVQPGDNLYRIALKFNTTMQAIMQLNGLANPNVIYVGQVLKIPGGTAAASGTPVPGATPAAPGIATAEPVPANTASNVGFAFGIGI